MIEDRHITTSAREVLPRACTLYTGALHHLLCCCVRGQSSLSEVKSLNGDVVAQKSFKYLELHSSGWRASITRAGKTFKGPTRATAEQARSDVETLLKKAALLHYTLHVISITSPGDQTGL